MGSGVAAAVGGLVHRQRWALSTGVLAWCAAFAVGWRWCDPHPYGLIPVRPDPGLALFSEILTRNVGVASALWLSGLLTAGVAVLPATLAVGALAGVTWGQALPVLGLEAVVRHVLPHLGVEFLAVGCAVGAGLVPFRPLWRSVTGAGQADWRAELADSGRLWGVVLVLLAVAAGVETWIST
ncbi:stage II sporulation protein M [Kitasatospora sp. NPDC089913]|uniref:stage II sporulation protein M n=1 Tax=Kitasatospora sp. NPDC089913 TaxID=3364080 RepID=UPI00380B0AC9